MTATGQVILVDENDNPIGTAEKMAAHRGNLCHRAFSVYIFRNSDKSEVLLQQRASDKYHCANLWTNTCCSHPQPGEDVIAAGQRRLQEEMGIVTPLTLMGKFHYVAHFDNGLTENEVDHVLVGLLDQDIIHYNPAEVQAYQWVNVVELKADIEARPERFTPWFLRGLEIAITY